jgi:hypothetical protein
MGDSIGLGLALNVLFWVGVVIAACVAGVFVGKEFFPGGYRKGPGHERARRRPRSRGRAPRMAPSRRASPPA